MKLKEKIRAKTQKEAYKEKTIFKEFVKWLYSLSLQPWHTYVQCINSFSFIQYYKCIASSLEMGATMTCFHRKEAVTTGYSGEKVNNYTSNNFVLSLKERGSMCSIAKDHCFRPVSPATAFAQDTRGDLKHKHSTWASQSDRPGYKSQLCSVTGRHSNKSDHDTFYKEEDSNNSYLTVTPKSQNSHFQDVAQVCDY